MRIALAVALLLAYPAEILVDEPQPGIRQFVASHALFDIASAVIGVRLRSSRSLTMAAERLTIHNGTVLVSFKPAARLPAIGGNVEMVELPGWFRGENNDPPWDPYEPIPSEGDWIMYLAWDPDYGQFTIV